MSTFMQNDDSGWKWSVRDMGGPPGVFVARDGSSVERRTGRPNGYVGPAAFLRPRPGPPSLHRDRGPLLGRAGRAEGQGRRHHGRAGLEERREEAAVLVLHRVELR